MSGRNGSDLLARLMLCAGGLGAAAAAMAADWHEARSAASQTWSPFVLVIGLLLVGRVLDDEGVFADVGDWIARVARRPSTLYLGSVALVGVTAALLNLDTSVAFLTPVLAYAARDRAAMSAPLLTAGILLSNAGSLFLPGANLTNLIVFQHAHVTGGRYISQLGPAALAAFVVVAAVIAAMHRKAFRGREEASAVVEAARPRVGAEGDRRPAQATLSPHLPNGPGARRFRVAIGVPAAVAVVACVLVLSEPAIPVAVVGLVVVGIRVAEGRRSWAESLAVLGLPVLSGLFGLAVALGTLGRSWSGPADLLAHVGVFPTAFLAAGTALVVNNLPAAALLAARPSAHPLALLVGLNLGPNLFVTGSLSWYLWRRSLHGVPGGFPTWRAVRVGAVATPLAIVVAVAVLSGAGLA